MIMTKCKDVLNDVQNFLLKLSSNRRKCSDEEFTGLMSCFETLFVV